MALIYSYARRDYPDMETCPGYLVAETEGEIWKVMELHASVAHGEESSDWSNEDRQYLKILIESE